jgi:hypothetical protein
MGGGFEGEERLMNPTSVPVALFEVLAAKYGKERESYPVEESSNPSDVVVIDEAKAGVSCVITLQKFTRGGHDYANFRLWPRKPEREWGLVFAAQPIFTIFGGPRETGLWTAVSGEQLQMSVVLDYGYYSKIDLREEWGRKIIAFMAIVLEAAGRLAEGTSGEIMWREEVPG